MTKFKHEGKLVSRENISEQELYERLESVGIEIHGIVFPIQPKETVSVGKKNNISESETFENHKKSEYGTLWLTHSNCYTAKIAKEDIVYIVSNEEITAVCIRKGYTKRMQEEGLLRFDSMTPFDKDEIVNIEYTENGVKKTKYVPSNNVSGSNSCILNSRSKIYEDEEHILIQWK